MQYSKSQLSEASLIALTWHGEDTRVNVASEGGKIDVKKGQTIEVTQAEAENLLSYSTKWTLKGDKPVVHGYEEAQRVAAVKADQRARARSAKDGRKSVRDVAAQADELGNMDATSTEFLTDEEVDAMKDKEVLLKILADRGTKLNPEASIKDIREELKGVLATERDNATKSNRDVPNTINEPLGSTTTEGEVGGTPLAVNPKSAPMTINEPLGTTETEGEIGGTEKAVNPITVPVENVELDDQGSSEEPTDEEVKLAEDAAKARKEGKSHKTSTVKKGKVSAKHEPKEGADATKAPATGEKLDTTNEANNTEMSLDDRN